MLFDPKEETLFLKVKKAPPKSMTLFISDKPAVSLQPVPLPTGRDRWQHP